MVPPTLLRCCLALAVALLTLPAPGLRAQGLLPGEFSNIELGRELIEPERWPTLRELRVAVAEPRIRLVLMLRLPSHENPHHLPVWSPDGQRLAFQRSRPEFHESKLLLYPTLGALEPTLLTERHDAYDYLFRWALNAEAAYCFTRLAGGGGPSQLLMSGQVEESPQIQPTGKKNCTAPALYRRTDGIWRLAYESDGQLVHEAWSDEGVVQPPIDLFPGTAPGWSRDGYRLLALRSVRNADRVGQYEVAIRNLRNLGDTILPRLNGETLRSPCWSPNEEMVAWFSRVGGDNAPWNIRTARLDDKMPVREVAADVVVNPDFASQGPSWEPSGERIWCFSHEHRQQAYYPLIAADVAGGTPIVVDYPQRCTSPQDLALNPATEVPEMAFVGKVGPRRDVFVIFLNHY